LREPAAKVAGLCTRRAEIGPFLPQAARRIRSTFLNFWALPTPAEGSRRRDTPPFPQNVNKLAGVLGGDLVPDCMGEIANVITGQAKTLLAGTSYQFAFVLPTVLADSSVDIRPTQVEDSLVIALSSDLGAFTMQLYLKGE
jgi:hypothetical protein